MTGTPNPRRFLSPREGLPLDLTMSLVLFACAAALRLPNFMTVPSMTDEYGQVDLAAAIAGGTRFPIVGTDPYDGPVFHYMLAAAFRLFGLNLYVPREFMVFFGALTVVAMYWMGKEFSRGNRLIGLVAAALLGVNLYHILVNSHVAWPNGITPLFAILALLAYYRGTRSLDGKWLCGAGALYGLALQTHPSVLALAPAFLIDFLWERRTRDWLRSPAPYLAFIAALVFYSPVLYYNLTTGLRSLRVAAGRGYALETAPTLATTFQHVGPVMAMTARLGLGSFGSAGWAAIGEDPRIILFWLGTAPALVWLARHDDRFPLIVVATAFVFLAVFNQFYRMPWAARYFEFVLPLIFYAWAKTGFTIWSWLGTRFSRRARLMQMALAILLGVLLSTPLIELRRYYDDAYVSGDNNTAILSMIETIRGRPDVPVMIEWTLSSHLTDFGGTVMGGLAFYLGMENRGYDLVSTRPPANPQGLRDILRTRQEAYLILLKDAPARLGNKFPLQVVVDSASSCSFCQSPDDVALYYWRRE